MASKVISLRINPEGALRLDKLKDVTGLTRGAVMRQLIDLAEADPRPLFKLRKQEGVTVDDDK